MIIILHMIINNSRLSSPPDNKCTQAHSSFSPPWCFAHRTCRMAFPSCCRNSRSLAPWTHPIPWWWWWHGFPCTLIQDSWIEPTSYRTIPSTFHATSFLKRTMLSIYLYCFTGGFWVIDVEDRSFYQQIIANVHSRTFSCIVCIFFERSA